MKARNPKTLISIISIVLCTMILAGTTFAWFVDVASNKNNEVKIANFAVDLLAEDGTTSIKGGSADIFDGVKLEPGAFVAKKLYAKNIGEIDLKHQIEVKSENVDAKNYLQAAIIVGDTTAATWDEIKAAAAKTALLTDPATAEAGVLAPEASKAFTVALYMVEDAPATIAGTSAKITVKVNAGQTNDAAPYTQIVNLVKNGDFAQVIDPETNWSTANQAGNCVATIKSAEGRPDYLSIVRAAGESKSPKVVQTLELPVGTMFKVEAEMMNVNLGGTYELEGETKSYAGKNFVDIYYKDAEGNTVGQARKQITLDVANGEWTAWSEIYTVPEGAVKTQIEFGIALGCGEVCFDNIVVSVVD